MSSGEMGFEFGHPAEASSADRTVEIEARDILRFEPASIDVQVGETILFRIHNVGAAAHEFVIGPDDLQDEHEEEMQAMASGGMHMEDEPNAIRIDPGDTKELAWTFTRAGILQFACHEPGHFAGGMVGTITVAAA